jgi:hypothetical protein
MLKNYNYIFQEKFSFHDYLFKKNTNLKNKNNVNNVLNQIFGLIYALKKF